MYDWYYEKVGKENSLQPNVSFSNTIVEEFDENNESLLAPDRLAQYSRRKISSAQSLRPKTANTVHSKVYESRPVSAVKLPIQAFVGSGEPQIELKEVDFQTSYTSYKPIGEDEEKKAEAKFQQFRKKDLTEKRLRDEMKQKVDL